MPHPTESRLLDGQNDRLNAATMVNHLSASLDELHADVIAIMFGYLAPEAIMPLRRVCTKWRDAAKKAIVPLTDFVVDGEKKINAMASMATALPNMQQISINYPHNYSRLKDNLFKFHLLQKLTISGCNNKLGLDLETLVSGLRLLRELKILDNSSTKGNIASLRVLIDTLEVCSISYSPSPPQLRRLGDWGAYCIHKPFPINDIKGNFMDLADFPRLKSLNLIGTHVTGDIRDIGECDFLNLEALDIPSEVLGGRNHEFQRISDVPDAMHAIHRLQQRSNFRVYKPSGWYLSKLSPDSYDDGPFSIQLVKAGTRRGWRWIACEVNWLDPLPDPDRSSSDYDAYVKKIQHIERSTIYKGFYQPPTEEQYRRLGEEGALRWWLN
mmetsp:Transcript_31816/g.53859  ORF Transcript_31816/g.53859 Transcript_31816/m.53859 type:complete len:383 (-) Transcript_31816:26-1174(-)